MGHWDETCLGTELMTGFLNTGSGVTNPLSTISIGTLEDLGYSVTIENAEPYSLLDINTSFCCFPSSERRNLRRTQKENFNPKAPQLKGNIHRVPARQGRPREQPRAATIRVAKTYAKRELKAARNRAPPKVPEGLTYVGGEILQVFVVDEDNKIQDFTFRWSEVKDFEEDEEESGKIPGQGNGGNKGQGLGRRSGQGNGGSGAQGDRQDRNRGRGKNRNQITPQARPSKSHISPIDWAD